MCDNCIEFLIEHFIKGFTPIQTKNIWVAAHADQKYEHFFSVVEELFNDPQELYKQFLLWKTKNPNAELEKGVNFE